MRKKQILIYGDSNTHGYRADDGLRFDADKRWTGICQHEIASWATILEEGLNGRTTCHNEQGMSFRNGLSYIEPCLRSHLPLDMVCVMLGSNDLKAEFHQEAEDIAENAARVLAKARWVAASKYPDYPCKYVLISPPEITEALLSGPFAGEFEGLATVEKSKAFSSRFKDTADRYNFLYFDAAAVAKPGNLDGLHLDVENHRKLGVAFATWLNHWPFSPSSF